MPEPGSTRHRGGSGCTSRSRVSPKTTGPRRDDDGDARSARPIASAHSRRSCASSRTGISTSGAPAGSRIELGGEFGFAVGRDGDDDHERRDPGGRRGAPRERLRRACRRGPDATARRHAGSAARVRRRRQRGRPLDRGDRGGDAGQGRPDPRPDLHRQGRTRQRPASRLRRDRRRRRQGPGAVSPARAASIAASMRLLTPSLSRMCVTWTLAVFGLMNSSRAIWPLVRPRATSARTSASRADRPSSANGVASLAAGLPVGALPAASGALLAPGASRASSGTRARWASPSIRARSGRASRSRATSNRVAQRRLGGDSVAGDEMRLGSPESSVGGRVRTRDRGPLVGRSGPGGRIGLPR